jgi:hypothetical protein
MKLNAARSASAIFLRRDACAVALPAPVSGRGYVRPTRATFVVSRMANIIALPSAAAKRIEQL